MNLVPGIVFFRTQPRPTASRRVRLSSSNTVAGPVAGQVLHGPVMQIGDDFRFPAVPDIGAHRTRSQACHDIKHLQQIGRTHLHRQIDRKLLVRRIAMERQVVHQLVLVDQESHRLVFGR